MAVPAAANRPHPVSVFTAASIAACSAIIAASSASASASSTGSRGMASEARNCARVIWSVHRSGIGSPNRSRGWNVTTARAALDRLRRFDLLVAEQPIAPGDTEAMASLRHPGGTPIMADESVFTLADAWNVMAPYLYMAPTNPKERIIIPSGSRFNIQLTAPSNALTANGTLALQELGTGLP